jgi:hypothetical protein
MIRGCNRLQYLRMNACIVVAGKAAHRFHGQINLAENRGSFTFPKRSLRISESFGGD